MATTQSLVIQMIHYQKDGTQTILNPKTIGSVITVDRSGNSNIPASVATLQTLVNTLGALAFKNNIATMTAATSGLAGTGGLVPPPPTGKQGAFLRGDATWAVPETVTYEAFKAATANSAGTSGLVPAPSAGSQEKFLKGDGTWGNPPKADFPVFTGATDSTDGAAGLVTAPKIANKGQFLRGDGAWATPTDTKYTHPSHTAYTSGFYKVTTDNLGHVISATKVTKEDITALGIPGEDTNTWRPVSDNLTTSSATNALSANQGVILKGLVDGKAAAGHDHEIADIKGLGDSLNNIEPIKVQAETPTEACIWYKIDVEE